MADLHVPIRAGTRHRLPRRRSSTTSSSNERVTSASTCVAYTNAADDHRRGLPRHRGPRRPVLRLGPRDAAPTTPRSWQYDGAGDAAAAEQRAPRATTGQRARRRSAAPPAAASRPAATRPCSTRAASSRSCKRHFAPLHAGDGRGGLRRPRRRCSCQVCRRAVRRTRPRADDRLLLRGRLDPAHRRRPVHPHRGDPPAAARQHRPARRRHHGPARPRLASRAPPTSRPSTTCCPATSRCRTPTATATSASYIEADGADGRLLGPHATPTWSACSRPGGATPPPPTTTAASTTCRASPATTRTYQTTLRHARRQGRRASSCWARTRPSARPTRGCTAWRWPSSTGWWCATSSRSRAATLLAATAPRSRRASCAPRTSAPRSSSCPAAAHTEKDGTFTNTQRLLQWHHKAVEPQGDCRTDLWFIYHLGRIDPGEAGRLQRPEGPADPRPDLGLPDRRAARRARRRGRAARDQRLGRRTARRCPAFTELKDDGSTACGCWIYCGCYADGVNQTARRTPRRRAELGRRPSGAGPGRPTGASSTTGPRPTPRAGRGRSARSYVWWDERAGRVDRPRRARLRGDQAARLPAARGRRRPTDADRGDEPFIMQADGKGWLFAPTGLPTGRCPTHYEPQESPVRQPAVRAAAQPGAPGVPARRATATTRSPATRADVYPYVVTTYRLTEHHTAGGHEPRSTPYLSELQPEMFCEVSPELAAERGLDHGGWATIVTARGAIEARVLVTDRMPPLRVEGRAVHQIGLPYHWGSRGAGHRRRGQRAARRSSLDPNVHIQEVKALTCDIRPGRRPRGPALPELVEPTYRVRARRWRPTPMKVDLADARRSGGGYDDQPGRGWASSPTPRSASAARPARSPARSGTSVPDDGPRASPACPTTTPAPWAPTPGATSPSSSSGAEPGRRRTGLRWLMRSDVCKHCSRPRASRSARPGRCSAPSSAPWSSSTTSATAAATACRPARSG